MDHQVSSSEVRSHSANPESQPYFLSALEGQHYNLRVDLVRRVYMGSSHGGMKLCLRVRSSSRRLRKILSASMQI